MTAPNATETRRGRENPLEQAQPHGYDQPEFPVETSAAKAGSRPPAADRPRVVNEEARHLRAARDVLDGAASPTGAVPKQAVPGESGKWDHEDDRLLDGRARLYRD